MFLWKQIQNFGLRREWRPFNFNTHTHTYRLFENIELANMMSHWLHLFDFFSTVCFHMPPLRAIACKTLNFDTNKKIWKRVVSNEWFQKLGRKELNWESRCYSFVYGHGLELQIWKFLQRIFSIFGQKLAFLNVIWSTMDANVIIYNHQQAISSNTKLLSCL